MDTISSEHRSWNMSRIMNRDTKPELIVRSLLHHKGYRFRLHRKDLPGKPDIVLPRFKKIILVHAATGIAMKVVDLPTTQKAESVSGRTNSIKTLSGIR